MSCWLQLICHDDEESSLNCAMRIRNHRIDGHASERPRHASLQKALQLQSSPDTVSQL